MSILDDINEALRKIEDSKQIIICSETMFPAIEGELEKNPELGAAFNVRSVPDAMLPDVNTVYICENPSKLLGDRSLSWN